MFLGRIIDWIEWIDWIESNIPIVVNESGKEAVLNLEKAVQFEKSKLSEYRTLVDDVFEVALILLDDIFQNSKVQMHTIQELWETISN